MYEKECCQHAREEEFSRLLVSKVRVGSCSSTMKTLTRWWFVCCQSYVLTDVEAPFWLEFVKLASFEGFFLCWIWRRDPPKLGCVPCLTFALPQPCAELLVQSLPVS